MKPFIPAIIWLMVITSMSGMAVPSLPKFDLISFDKLAHAGVYGIFVLLALGGLVKSGRALKGFSLITIVGFAILWGASMEWMQATFFPHRAYEFDDMIANSVGAILAWPVFILGRKYGILR